MEETSEQANASPTHTSEGPERSEWVCSRARSRRRATGETPYNLRSQKGVRGIKCAGIDSFLLQVDESSTMDSPGSPGNE